MKNDRSSAFNWAVAVLIISLVLTTFFSLMGKELTSKPHTFDFGEDGIVTIPSLNIWWFPVITTLITCGSRLHYLISRNEKKFDDEAFPERLCLVLNYLFAMVAVLVACIALISIILSDHSGILEAILSSYIVGTSFFLMGFLLSGIVPFLVALYERITSIIKSPAFKGKPA